MDLSGDGEEESAPPPPPPTMGNMGAMPSAMGGGMNPMGGAMPNGECYSLFVWRFVFI